MPTTQLSCWLVLLAAGCQAQPRTVIGDGRDDGVRADATEAADAADLCFGPAPFIVCLPEPPTGPATFAWSSIDTYDTYDGTTANKCANGIGEVVAVSGTSVCAISATTLMLKNVVATGPRPLVFVASETISVEGGLLARGTSLGAGPGANSASCADVSMVGGTESSHGAGGGAGGSFGEAGGDGGGGATSAPGGIAAPANSQPENVLRGGCPGGRGGAGTYGVSAIAGDSGGAVYLVARDAITIAGTIDASGTGGGRGEANGGGGGGGSGGMIVLAAPTLAFVSGSVFANGGGGGGGASSDVGVAGHISSSPSSPGLSGAADSGGATPGGNGGFQSVAAESAAQATAGAGGGGGGSVGVIRILSGQEIPATNVSPAPS
jgi:hypothetical protein